MTISQSTVRNHLLKAMSEEDFARLKPDLEPLALAVKDVLVPANEPIEHVYFMEEGLASVVAISPDDERIEVGHIGREGMAGEPVLLGVTSSPNQTFIQVAGSGLRIRAEDLTATAEASPSLRALLLRFVQTLLIQTSHSALANGRYSIQERLARWLLMCHDRMDGDDLPLTHEFLSLIRVPVADAGGASRRGHGGAPSSGGRGDRQSRPWSHPPSRPGAAPRDRRRLLWPARGRIRQADRRKLVH
jgi:CRP-like cAMP-binding protein